MQESASIAIGDLARRLRAEGRSIVSLAIGEPDFDTPEHVKRAAAEAMAAGHTKYTNVDGTRELKQAIVAKLSRENELEYSAAEVIVSNGAKQSIFNALFAVLEPGDEVVIPAPYWVSYPEMAAFAGGVPVAVAAGPEQGFKLTPALLAAALTPRSRVLILNSPNNPTGAIYSRAELAALAEVVRTHPRLLVISDDIYEHIRWNDAPFATFAAAAPDLRERTVTVNGVSKAFAMTGWRIGYAAAPTWLVDAMRKIQGQCTTNPNSIAQYAAAAALNGGLESVHAMAREFAQRHAYVVGALNALPGVRCAPAAGAFYAFPEVTDLLRRKGLVSDVELAARLLETVGVAVVPGSAYGMPGFLRLSYATSMAELRNAFERLATFVE